MIVDVDFVFFPMQLAKISTTQGPTLRRYHNLLWCKLLSNGTLLDLRDDETYIYLCTASALWAFSPGSDTSMHSYEIKKRK
jgi:hypothetical protein